MFRHIEPLERVWSGSLCPLHHRSIRWITFHAVYRLAHHPQRYTPRTAAFYLLLFYTYFYYYTLLTVNLVKNCMIFNCGFFRTHCSWGHAVAHLVEAIRFPMVSLDFFIDIILPAAL